jgi:hypothetical protein
MDISNMNTRTFKQLPALALLLAATGCGGPLLKVTGTLTYKGQPIPSTLVTFHPDEDGKRASHGITDDNGHFTLSYSSTEMGALPGKDTVFLKYHMSAAEEMHEIPPKANKEQRAIIAKYGYLTTSPLHYEITENGQVIDIKLE